MRIIAYLHVSKESMLEIGTEAGLKGDALEMFKWACTEVSVELDVNARTGGATIVKVDGRKVL